MRDCVGNCLAPPRTICATSAIRFRRWPTKALRRSSIPSAWASWGFLASPERSAIAPWRIVTPRTGDQLSFTTPILPITTPTGTPGDMADVFAVGPGRLPQGGVIDPAFIPVYSQFLGFVDCTTGLPTTDTSQCSVFDNGQPNPFGVFGGNSINLFGLEVPRHF